MTSDQPTAETKQVEPTKARSVGGNLRVCLNVKSYTPCSVHGPRYEACECAERKLIDEYTKEEDLATTQFARLVMALILNSTQNVQDTTNTTRSVANATACTTPTICAGTNNTAAVVADYALNTQTETVAATVGTYNDAGATGNFTITGTIVALADRAYKELGLRVTIAGNTFMICRDIIANRDVSGTGTLAVTYTISNG